MPTATITRNTDRSRTGSRMKPAERQARKYDDDLKRITRRAQELRGSKHAISPITVTRVKDALGDTKPMDALKGMTIKAAIAYAGGDRDVKPPARTVELYGSIDDPFAKGRGFVAACLALAGK